MGKVLLQTLDGKKVEGHLIGAQKIIYGDLRDRGIIQTGHGPVKLAATDGTVLFDRRVDGIEKNWFILDLETGGRIKTRNTEPDLETSEEDS